MNEKDELLAALAVERQDQRWWTGVHPAPPVDDDITCRRRLNALVAEFDAADRRTTRWTG